MPRFEHKQFTEQVCIAPMCGLFFQPLSWMPWRVDGYCSAKCAKECGVEYGKKTNQPKQENDDAGQIA